jgi:phosphate transport system permease protein
MFSSGASLSVAMYVFAKERGEFDVAFGIAGILLILTLIISVAAQILEARTKER